MRGVIAISLLVFVDRACAEGSVDELSDKLADRLFDVSLKVAAPPRAIASHAVPLRAYPRSSPHASSSPLIGHRPQLLGEMALGGRMRTNHGRLQGIAAEGEEEAKEEVPYEVYYEGGPAKSAAYLPTASIITLVGIIPAVAAWSQQAWVKYKITSRGISITSGFGGNEQESFAYDEIRKIRTLGRLFGDGDFIFALSNNKQIEMRNVPDFDKAKEFVLKFCPPDVVEEYKSQQR